MRKQKLPESQGVPRSALEIESGRINAVGKRRFLIRPERSPIPELEMFAEAHERAFALQTDELPQIYRNENAAGGIGLKLKRAPEHKAHEPSRAPGERKKLLAPRRPGFSRIKQKASVGMTGNDDFAALRFKLSPNALRKRESSLAVERNERSSLKHL